MLQTLFEYRAVAFQQVRMRAVRSSAQLPRIHHHHHHHHRSSSSSRKRHSRLRKVEEFEGAEEKKPNKCFKVKDTICCSLQSCVMVKHPSTYFHKRTEFQQLNIYTNSWILLFFLSKTLSSSLVSIIWLKNF